MSTTSEKPIIRISPNPPVFDLPVIVALEEGLFDKVGLDVRFAAAYRDRDQDEGGSQREVLKRQKESLFEAGSADAYNVCEWGGIDRLERGAGEGKIAALRPAIAAQAILALDERIQTPRDLAGIPVGVNEFTGSHYVTVHLLEGLVGKDKVKLEHIGAPETRLEQLQAGTVRAVTVMEPFITLGLKQGAHIVALSFYRGAEVTSPDLEAKHREAYFTALDEAADRINEDFGRYAHHISATANGGVTPEEIARNYGHFIRYRHAQRYDNALFTASYDWMHERGYSEGVNTHATLVAG